MCTRYPIINRVSELKVHIELTRFVQPEKIEIDANERAVNEKSQYCFFVCTTFDSFLNDFDKPIIPFLNRIPSPHPGIIQTFFGTGVQCIPTQILVRRGICGDRRALWNESEYGEDIAVPDQKKTAKISGTTGNRLIDGERDESGDEGYERL